MNCWDILNIRPTTSKQAIKMAYVALLKKFNPEDDPESFKKNRAAYEEALQESRGLSFEPTEINALKLTLPLSENRPTTTNDLPSTLTNEKITDIATLKVGLQQLYQDIDKRGVLTEWIAFMQAPVFWRSDLNREAAKASILFLADHHMLPKIIMSHWNEFLKFSEQYTYWLKQPEMAKECEKLQHYIGNLHLRMDQPVKFSNAVSFEELHTHLLRREEIENIFIQGSSAIETYEKIYSNISASFEQDWDLHGYVAWIYKIFGSLEKAEKIYATLKIKCPSPEYLIELADIYYEQNRYVEAKDIYHQVLNEKKESLRAQKGLALCYAHQPNSDISLLTAELLLEEISKKLPADIHLKSVLTTVRRRRLDQMLEKFNHPNPSKGSVEETARLFYDLGDPTECLVFLEEKYGVDPEFDQRDTILQPLCHYQRESHDFAINAFTRVIKGLIERGESPLEAIKEFVMTYPYLHDLDTIENLLMPQTLFLTHPDIHDPDYLFAAGLIYARYVAMKDQTPEEDISYLKKAINCVQLALEHQPDNHKYHFQFGLILCEAKRYEESIESLLYAKSVFRYYERIPRTLGLCYMNLQKYDEAIGQFKFALELDQSCWQHCFVLPKIYKIYSITKQFDLCEPILRQLIDSISKEEIDEELPQYIANAIEAILDTRIELGPVFPADQEIFLQLSRQLITHLDRQGHVNATYYREQFSFN